MASLTGTKIKDTYDALLKVSDNGALDGTLQTITDGLGNNSALSLSTAGASVGGTLAVSGATTLSSALDITGAISLANTPIPSAGTARIFSRNTDSNLYIQTGSGNQISFLDGSQNTLAYFNPSLISFSISNTERMRIASSGDISFRDSSTNEAFYWDASAASLGIGTDSPDLKLSINGAMNLRNSTRAGAFEIDSSGNLWLGTATTLGNIYLETGHSTTGLPSTGTPRMTISGDGNVGIGTSPAAKLEVKGDTSGFRVITTNATSVTLSMLADLGLGYDNAAQIVAGQQSSNNGYLAFNTKTAGVGSEKMRIDASGNVGIGTQNPFSQGSGARSLEISGDNYGQLYVYGSGASPARGTFMARGSSFGDVYLGAVTNSNLVVGTNETERMRITSGGFFKASNSGVYRNSSGPFHELVSSEGSNAIVELTNSNNSNPYGVTMYFSGADPNNATNYVFGAYASTSSTWMYRIFSNGTVAARSDIRLKKNIEPARSGYLQDLCQLEVVKYNWYNNEDGSPKEIGLIAQQVETVFPNLVITDKIIKTREVEQEDGTILEEKYEDGDSKSIKQSVLPFMLLKAIQEQQEIINDLKARIEQLEA